MRLAFSNRFWLLILFLKFQHFGNQQFILFAPAGAGIVRGWRLPNAVNVLIGEAVKFSAQHNQGLIPMKWLQVIVQVAGLADISETTVPAVVDIYVKPGGFITGAFDNVQAGFMFLRHLINRAQNAIPLVLGRRYVAFPGTVVAALLKR